MPEAGESTSGGANQTDISTLVAFAALVIIGGGNAVAVRFSNGELPPFWGAAARFGLAAGDLLGDPSRPANRSPKGQSAGRRRSVRNARNRRQLRPALLGHLGDPGQSVHGHSVTRSAADDVLRGGTSTRALSVERLGWRTDRGGRYRHRRRGTARTVGTDTVARRRASSELPASPRDRSSTSSSRGRSPCPQTRSPSPPAR